jgi:hypothetical protein
LIVSGENQPLVQGLGFRVCLIVSGENQSPKNRGPQTINCSRSLNESSAPPLFSSPGSYDKTLRFFDCRSRCSQPLQEHTRSPASIFTTSRRTHPKTSLHLNRCSSPYTCCFGKFSSSSLLLRNRLSSSIYGCTCTTPKSGCTDVFLPQKYSIGT